jgi:putative heme-binding domain-containing protein
LIFGQVLTLCLEMEIPVSSNWTVCGPSTPRAGRNWAGLILVELAVNETRPRFPRHWPRSIHRKSRGKQTFQKVCSSCHRVDGGGHEIAPTLLTMRNRTPENILLNVLDPNRKVNPNYVMYGIIISGGCRLVRTFSFRVFRYHRNSAQQRGVVTELPSRLQRQQRFEIEKHGGSTQR